MILPLLNTVLLLIVSVFSICLTAIADPLDYLKASEPSLYLLYQRYPGYHKQLGAYADMQGFEQPVENLATVVHELIHIDSFVHRGYGHYKDGNYFEPYLAIGAWPALNNREIESYLSPEDISSLGMIYTQYLKNTPQNSLGNILDEVNAYSQSLPLICGYASYRAAPHLRAFIGHINLVEVYLKVLSRSFDAQYRQLTQNQISRGALETIVADAYKTLNQCYRMGISEADPRAVLKVNTRAFAAQARQ